MALFGLFSNSLENALDRPRKVRIKGICFKIKKIDLLSHLSGSQVALQIYDTYKIHGNVNTEISEGQIKKMKQHFRDVFLAGVISPKLKANEDEKQGVFVDKLFNDSEITNKLYNSIIEYTYGKKKLK